MQFWNELEGKTTEEGYRLGRLVRSEGRTAWFETETGGTASQPAILSLTESLTDADEVIARLQAAQRLQQPALMTIRKIGRVRLDQTPFIYALMEHADQNLADILRGQTLSRDEAHQVAETMVAALTAIHQQGLVHGRVEPASLLAVGEAVKLRSDCLQTPGGTRAGDVAGIGETLFQAFTQRKPSSAEDARINRIPAPFAEIVRNTLSARWGLAQVAAVLKPATTPAAGTAAMPRPAATAPVVAGATSSGGARQMSASSPPGTAEGETARVPPPSGTAQAIDREEEAEPDSARRSPAIYAVVGIVLVLILGWLLLRHKSSPSVRSSGVISRIAPAPTAAPAPKSKPSPATGARIQSHETRPKGEQPQADSAAAAPRRRVWRVVIYTYHHQDQAQEKADEINHDHPGLNATAYSPRGDSQHFLVVLGGPMDQKQAFAIRDKAISEGLAADSYVQNFSE